jgi:hypothetical protein
VHDVDHSPASSAWNKNEWRYTSTSLIMYLHDVDSDSLTFTLVLIDWFKSDAS